MALPDLISEEVIRVPLISDTKFEVIKELIQTLKDANKISEFETIYNALRAREDLGTTGLEYGIAVPHAKTPAVQSLTAAIGISPDGVDFGAIDGKPSQLIFLILTPPDKSGPYIELLAEIASITRSKSFFEMLILATSSKKVMNIFHSEEYLS
jgi:mannitol/fructose-specific phosphotransferase system IIA component (Ntr-type)